MVLVMIGITKDQENRLIEIFNKKGLDEYTRSRITNYVNMNSEIFENDIDRIITRIGNNIGKSVAYECNFFKNFILQCSAYYESKSSKIVLNKFYKPILESKKKLKDSIIYHEIDHAATTDKIDWTEEEKKIIIESYNSKNPLKRFVNQKSIKNLDDFLKRGKYVSGIRKFSKNRALNEGITVFKQIEYDKYMGADKITKFFTRKLTYQSELLAVCKISDIIGKENLIKFQFNNQFDEMCELFSKRTNGVGNLKEISKKLDEVHHIKKYFRPFKFLKNSIDLGVEFRKCKKENQKFIQNSVNEEMEKDRKINKDTKKFEFDMDNLINSPEEIANMYIASKEYMVEKSYVTDKDGIARKEQR